MCPCQRCCSAGNLRRRTAAADRQQRRLLAQPGGGETSRPTATARSAAPQTPSSRRPVPWPAAQRPHYVKIDLRRRSPLADLTGGTASTTSSSRGYPRPLGPSNNELHVPTGNRLPMAASGDIAGRLAFRALALSLTADRTLHVVTQTVAQTGADFYSQVTYTRRSYGDAIGERRKLSISSPTSDRRNLRSAPAHLTRLPTGSAFVPARSQKADVAARSPGANR